MLPHIPDKKVVFAVTQSNYPTLLEAGIRIYEFTPGFLHSKTVVADDLYASVGSCNLDYRSFYLQFENGVWLCGNPAVLSVRDDFLSTLEVCQEITPDDCRHPLPYRIMQTIYRLFSPLFLTGRSPSAIKNRPTEPSSVGRCFLLRFLPFACLDPRLQGNETAAF